MSLNIIIKTLYSNHLIVLEYSATQKTITISEIGRNLTDLRKQGLTIIGNLTNFLSLDNFNNLSKDSIFSIVLFKSLIF